MPYEENTVRCFLIKSKNASPIQRDYSNVFVNK